MANSADAKPFSGRPTAERWPNDSNAARSSRYPVCPFLLPDGDDLRFLLTNNWAAVHTRISATIEQRPHLRLSFRNTGQASRLLDLLSTFPRLPPAGCQNVAAVRGVVATGSGHISPGGRGERRLRYNARTTCCM